MGAFGDGCARVTLKRGGNGKGMSSHWGWQAAMGWGVLVLDLTQMGRQAWIDTVNLQWHK